MSKITARVSATLTSMMKRQEPSLHEALSLLDWLGFSYDN